MTIEFTLKHLILGILIFAWCVFGWPYFFEIYLSKTESYLYGIEDGLHLMSERSYESYLEGVKQGRQSCAKLNSNQLN